MQNLRTYFRLLSVRQNLVLLGILIVLIAIFLTLYLVRQQQELRGRAIGEASTLEFVGPNVVAGNPPTATNQIVNLRLTWNPGGITNPTPTSIPTPTGAGATPTPTQGATAKRVFVTSEKHTGNLVGLSGADSLCQGHASAANLGGTWKVWLSSRTVSATARLSHFTGSYKLVDNTTVVANSWTDLTDGTLANPITKDEFGNTIDTSSVFNVLVWTHSFADGTTRGTYQVLPGRTDVPSDACLDWTTSSGAQPPSYHAGGIGSASQVAATWTYGPPPDGSARCDTLARLYCFEQ